MTLTLSKEKEDTAMRKEHDNVLITIITPILAILMLFIVGNPFESGYKNPLDKIGDAIKFASYGGRYEYNQAQFDYSVDGTVDNR